MSRRSALGKLAAELETEPARPAAGTTAMRSRPVRVTTDLEPAQHRRLTEWCQAAAAARDVPAVRATHVMRALVDLLLTDEAVSDRIRNSVGQ